MGKMRTFRCDDDTWRNFKLLCTMENVSMQNKLGDMVSDYVKTKLPETNSLQVKDVKSN
mgnify:FL=1|jgi:hypothetical protein